MILFEVLVVFCAKFSVSYNLSKSFKLVKDAGCQDEYNYNFQQKQNNKKQQEKKKTPGDCLLMWKYARNL